MAKLEGVKVVDMTGGEVTKVTYEGADYVKVPDGEPKSGDIGLFKENTYLASDFDIVISIDGDGDPELEDSGNWYAFYLTFFRKVNAPTLTDRVTSLESRVDALGGEKCCTLKVGDYVKVIREYCEHNVDDILKITATAEGHDFRVDRIGHDDYGFINEKHIVRATDEEVEKARAEAQSIAKWASIGRKPNEFKKGDIVALNQHSGGHGNGTIVEVVNHGNYRANDGSTWLGKLDWYKLIAPVEARFDKVEVDRDGL
jgi:hypothetical protein